MGGGRGSATFPSAAVGGGGFGGGCFPFLGSILSVSGNPRCRSFPLFPFISLYFGSELFLGSFRGILGFVCASLGLLGRGPFKAPPLRRHCDCPRERAPLPRPRDHAPLVETTPLSFGPAPEWGGHRAPVVGRGGGGEGASLMGLQEGSYRAAMGQKLGTYGALVGQLWGIYGALMGSNRGPMVHLWGSYGAAAEEP